MKRVLTALAAALPFAVHAADDGRIYQQTFSARLCVLFFLTIGCPKMMAAARLTMSVLLLNIPS
ncbi:hypothetical protein MJM45_28340, partial [Salmonella enterica subsp. enterica serovar Kentucky]|nr:hypothetical protein [Salmonella enterica subsp. enterica serovar Kentucky]